jgi:hypothetical protein
MLEVTADKSANLLKVRYTGLVGAAEAQRSVPLVQQALAELQPGFRLLSDLAGLKEMDLACVPYVEQVMDMCDDRGITTIVRIIPDPHKDIGLNIMSLFHYRRGVRIVTVETSEAAEAALAS